MNIKILHGIEGAKEAKGIAVIIDVFRAFTVEAYLMNNGAEKIISVGDIDFAYEYKKKNNDYILIGERKGEIQPGFDYGNSPTSIENIDFSGKTLIHTTSNGTQGIVNASNATEILTGSLVNARAIAEYIKIKNPEDVSLVVMGRGPFGDLEEDELCAEYIKSILDGETIDLSSKIDSLKETTGAKFFEKSLQGIFPERDFYLCTEVDKFKFVLEVEKNDGLKYIRKIEIKY